MQLTRAADYAARVMIHLAALPVDSRANRTELARAADVPEAFLGKILQSLVRSGLMVSQRGVAGGFALGKPASTVTLLDVIEAVDGPFYVNRCVGSGEGCHRFSWCPAHHLWIEAQAAMVKVLTKSSILDLARSAKQACASPKPKVQCALEVNPWA